MTSTTPLRQGEALLGNDNLLALSSLQQLVYATLICWERHVSCGFQLVNTAYVEWTDVMNKGKIYIGTVV